MSEEQKFPESRRRFLERALAVTVVSTLAPMTLVEELLAVVRTGVSGILGEYRIDLTNPAYAALRTVNGSVKLTNVGGLDQLDILLTRISETQFAAVEAYCTHDPCGLPIPSRSGEIVCPCHGATFTATGRRLSGPARYDLPTYRTSFDGTSVVVISIDALSRAPELTSGVVVSRNAAVTPDGSLAMLRVNSEHDLTVSVRIVATDGHLVSTGPISALSSGLQQYLFPLDGLPAGAYFVECLGNGHSIGIARLILCR